MSETSPPQRKWPGFVAWVVILLVVSAIVWRNQRREKAAKQESAPSPVVNLQIALTGKYAIGARALLSKSSGNTTKPAAELHQLLAPIDNLAKTGSQRLRVATIAAELGGKEDALERIDRVAAQDEISPEVQQDISDLRRIYDSGPGALDETARARLTERYGYFGQVALSFGLPDTDPLRKSILQQGRWIVILTIVVAVVGIVAGLLGVALFITAIVLLALGTVQRAYSPQPLASTVYVEMFAVYLLSFWGISQLLALVTDGKLNLAWEWAVAPVVAIAIGWGLLRGLPWQEIRRGLGWHSGKGWSVEIPLGIAGYFAGLPILAAGFAIMYWLIAKTGSTPSHPIVSEAASRSPLQILLVYSLASVWAPVIEETMFRGALFHHLRRRWGWLISSTVVAFLFAVVHPQGWCMVPALMAIAIVLAGLREWRGSILAPMAAHAFHNGVLITLLLLMS